MDADPCGWVVPPALRAVLNLHLRQLPHARRVALLTGSLAPLRGIPPGQAALAGALHDVGKIWVPAAVLRKAACLTAPERDLINRHPVHGARFIRQYWPDAPLSLLDAVLHHHERPDGRGYPDGLRVLTPLTELVAVSDMYDAVRERRSYKPGLTHRDAIRALQDQGFSTDLLSALEQAGAACEARAQ